MRKKIEEDERRVKQEQEVSDIIIICYINIIHKTNNILNYLLIITYSSERER